MPDSRARGVLLATVASVTWGTVPIAGTIALGGITAPMLTTLRLLCATLFLGLVIRRRHDLLRRPPRLVYLAALGLAANYLTYMWGLERAGPATSQVLIQTAPLFLIGFGVAWLRERLTAREIAGAFVALSGVALVSWEDAPGEPQRGVGILFILVASLTWGLYGAAHRKIGRDHAAGPTMTWIFLLSALATAPFAATEPLRRPDGVEIAAIVYLCVNTIVAYWSFAESVRRIEASLAAIITTLGPVITFALLLVTNRMDQTRVPYEALTLPKVLGAALVIGGVCGAVSGRR